MRLSRQGWYKKMTIAWSPLLLAGLMIAPSQALVPSNSMNITLETTFIAPPCTLEVPSKVYLGSITYGEKAYQPFTITMNCTSALKTDIYAQSMGVLPSGSIDTMEMSGSDNKALFWLEEGGYKVSLKGDRNDTTNGFCQGTNNRTCTLTPKTKVATDAQEGERSAVILFNIRYLT